MAARDICLNYKAKMSKLWLTPLSASSIPFRILNSSEHHAGSSWHSSCSLQLHFLPPPHCHFLQPSSPAPNAHNHSTPHSTVLQRWCLATWYCLKSAQRARSSHISVCSHISSNKYASFASRLNCYGKTSLLTPCPHLSTPPPVRQPSLAPTAAHSHKLFLLFKCLSRISRRSYQCS